MSEKERNIHRNGVDITQRLMAKNMIGEQPLKALSLETAKVKEVLSTDLPAIQTKDDKADTLYLLEDGTYLHVEYQTTAKKEDVVRFAGYVLGLYNTYKDKSPVFNSVVVYAPHITPGMVVNQFDTGGFRYQFQPIFLRELAIHDKYQEVLEKIIQDPDVHLSDEEKMVIVYRPLANKEIKDIERDALQVIDDLKNLANETEMAQLGSTIFVMLKKYLSDQAEKQIWEALSNMDVVKDWEKEKYRDVLKEMFIEGASPKMINMLIERTNYTEDEIEEIRKEAESES